MTYGRANRDFIAVSDLKSVEFIPVVALLALIVLIGVYPSVLSDPLHSTLETIMLGLGG